MKVDILDLDAFTALEPYDIEGYLLHNAWQRERSEPGQVSVWSKTNDGERYRVWLPLDYKLGDFVESIARTVKTVAQAENRSQLSILEDLDTVAIGDVVRVRSFDELNKESSTLPIYDGISLLEQAKNLLTAAANSAHQVRPVHPAKKNNVVNDFVSNLRLGQTERGSYIIKLVSPLQSKQLSIPGIPAPIPFARDAVAELLNALNALRAVSEDNFKRGRFIFELFEEAVQDGVSANLCEAVLPQSGLSQYRPLEVAVSWSFKLEVPPKQPPTLLEIPAQYMRYIAEAARVFREKNPEPYQISGYVVALRKENNEPGIVTVAAVIDERQRKVRIELTDEDYHRAIYAHENELEIICSGDLTQPGRLYRLDNPRNLRVLE